MTAKQQNEAPIKVVANNEIENNANTMKYLKWIGIALGLIAICAIGFGLGWLNYHADYDAGKTAGNTSGYNLGLHYGSVSGNSTGYLAGFNAGKDAGKIEGNSTGFNAGFTAGKEAGKIEGNSTGFNAGFTAGKDASGSSSPDNSDDKSSIEVTRFDGDSAYAIVMGLQTTHPDWFVGHTIKTIKGLAKGSNEYFSIATEDVFDQFVEEAKMANDNADDRASYVTDKMSDGAYMMVEDTEGNVAPVFYTNDNPSIVALGTWFPKNSLSGSYDLKDLTNL